MVAAHDDIHEPLDRIRSACLRMNQLIDDLLSLSQVARDELRRRTVDVSALVAEVVNELRRAEPERHVTVDVEPGMQASADPGLLRIVLENLVGNAFKFTSGMAHARVQIGQYRSEAGEVTYFVRDNGAGFNPLHAGRLFAAFQRLHSSSEFTGTGIGLAIVARVVRRHAGSIRAEGKPGSGATFHFTLGSE
jgi:light-regulated signal transduction histidine kinase (bacteriophytochrome)